MFLTRGRQIERPNLRDLLSFLLVSFLLFSVQEGKRIYPKQFSSAGFEETHSQKALPNKTEVIVFEEMENTLLEVFSGIYNIHDERFKRIYQGSGFIYGFGLSQKVYCSKQHNLFLSLDFKFYSKKGKSTFTEQETKLTLKPISFGGFYLFARKSIFPFAEVGLDYYPYKEECDLHSTSGSAWGFHLKGGILIPLPALSQLKIKLYLRYSKAKTEENNLEVNLGGIDYGLGFVYGFDQF